MQKRWMAGGVLMLCAFMAWAAGPAAVRKQVEASMLVTGSIDIAPDGRVQAHALDHTDKLTKGVAGFLAAVIGGWRFEPVRVDGVAKGARSRLSLRLIAKKRDDGDFMLRVASVEFGSPRDGESPRSLTLTPPRYPEDAARSGVGGSVYLVLKVGRDGRVIETVAEQTNLRLVARKHDLRRWREQLERAALSASRDWRFEPPTAGPEKDAAWWSIRVPVDFIPPDQRIPQYGEWSAYVPGPRQPVPWRTWDAGSIAADAVASGGVYPDRPASLRLLTPIDS